MSQKVCSFSLVSDKEVYLLFPWKMLNDDNFPTDTSNLQKEIEELIISAYEQYNSDDNAKLKRLQHERFLCSSLYEGLNRWFVALDASKPWLIYWILQSLDLLQVDLSSEIKEK